MNEKIAAYIAELNQQFRTGNAREHAYRPALKALVEGLLPKTFTVINEPRHIECGAPDYMLMYKELPVAFAEAKDLGDSDLDGTGKNKEQFSRYKQSLNSLFFTDYLSFHFYADGEKLTAITIAKIEGNAVVATDFSEQQFIDAVRTWANTKPQKITSPAKLAKLMAGKARMLADVIERLLEQDTEKKGSFWNKLNAFKEVLNKDLNEKLFADLYAQTIAYGLFAARLHDNTPDNFTRQEAANLIPHTNPFLRQIFQQLAGYDINDSIAWIVDDLVNIFAATDVAKLRKNFGKEMQKRDPMIHFYEDFLSHYDPATKKKFGVYYTPQPVVEFIIRAVDDILKSDFNLPKGLADNSKVDVKIREMEDGKDTPTEVIRSKHRVQVLDPATGTGTFLAEVVSRIKEQQQAGAWSAYVDEHLIPRVYGFEYMMAPYTIAHLKLDMLINWWEEQKLLTEHKNRVQIYLTNSLDQTELVNKHLLAEMIAREANEANSIKHNAPVMVMLGNPPYSVSSSNKSPWILNLLDDYKKNLNEKKLNLDDDYIKFIRLGQYYIERTGEGVLAYISNNSFLDGLIHRQMRHELMRCFDDIYILDLHGNNRKKETSPDGRKDENVFSIMQGVSINIFVKKPNSEDKPAAIHHFDLFGSRKEKYAFLSDNTLSSVHWQILQPQEPNLFFVPKDFGAKEEYDKGFRINDLMSIGGSGVKTERDKISIHYNNQSLCEVVNDFRNLDENTIRQKYELGKDSRDWKISKAKSDIITHFDFSRFTKTLNMTPFDERLIYYTGVSKGFIGTPGFSTMKHMLHPNICLCVPRQTAQDWRHVFISNHLLNYNYLAVGGQNGASTNYPLYLYPEPVLGQEQPRKPNLDETIWRTIENWVKFGQARKPLTANEQNGLLGFDAEPEQPHFLKPEDIFDYIYGVLHSPAYRAKYKEFLKVDFPRIPHPKNANEFEHFRSFGHTLRELHLMHNIPESAVLFPEGGNMVVERVNYEDGRVYINEKQFFDHVPQVAWEMYIGGYQPAQKWLKDRKGRTLSSDDVEHYRKIIFVLSETANLMQQIDEPYSD